MSLSVWKHDPVLSSSASKYFTVLSSISMKKKMTTYRYVHTVFSFEQYDKMTRFFFSLWFLENYTKFVSGCRDGAWPYAKHALIMMTPLRGRKFNERRHNFWPPTLRDRIYPMYMHMTGCIRPNCTITRHKIDFYRYVRVRTPFSSACAKRLLRPSRLPVLRILSHTLVIADNSTAFAKREEAKKSAKCSTEWNHCPKRGLGKREGDKSWSISAECHDQNKWTKSRRKPKVGHMSA